MRWYLNEASIQGQFRDAVSFEQLIEGLLRLRRRYRAFEANLRSADTFGERLVTPDASVRSTLQRSRNEPFRKAALFWIDRAGPFVYQDRLQEADDYFECYSVDVTDGGLGEAARRVRNREVASAISFAGGAVDFGSTPLPVDHGLVGDRLGRYDVGNVWELRQLEAAAATSSPVPTSWEDLVTHARERFPRLLVPDDVYRRKALASEPYSPTIRDRTIVLLSILNEYMEAREPDGSESPRAQEIVRQFFSGDRALFSPESPTNRREFAEELMFTDPVRPGMQLDGHWHGKISHRHFRLHFEWPVPAEQSRLKVLYLGPKITKG